MADKFVTFWSPNSRIREIRRAEFAPEVVAAEFAGPGFGLHYETDNRVQVGQSVNVFRIETDESAFDASLWTTAHVGSGSASHNAGGELDLGTGVTANSTAKITSVMKPRRMSGTSQRYITVVRLSDAGVANNIRRWGVFDDNDGYFYQLSGTDFSIVSRKAAVDTVVPVSSWNGPAKEQFDGTAGVAQIDLTKMQQYDFLYGGLSLRAIVNGRNAHSIGTNTLSAPLSARLTLPFRMESVNSGGATADARIFGRGQTILRMGPDRVIPRYRNIAAATTTVVKVGAGTLHRIVLNDPATSGLITVYDNTAGSGTKIGTINVPGAANSPFFLEYGLEFVTGLTVVTSSAMDLTVLLD